MVFCCVAKLCRESRPFLVQFYVANHAVLVTHFNPKKVVGDTIFFKRSAYVYEPQAVGTSTNPIKLQKPPRCVKMWVYYLNMFQMLQNPKNVTCFCPPLEFIYFMKAVFFIQCHHAHFLGRTLCWLFTVGASEEFVKPWSSQSCPDFCQFVTKGKETQNVFLRV